MKPKVQKYEVWINDSDTTFFLKKNYRLMRRKGFLMSTSKLIHKISAATDEEAMTIFNMRMGYESYNPGGISRMCPKCNRAYFYPEGSSQCPYCGEIK
jgi:hypothetical protein